MSKTKLAPSILAADFTRLGTQVNSAIEAGAEYIHVDVMDGQFVPNLSIGVPVVESLFPIIPASVLLDVHLMIETPDQLIPDFAKAGADVLTVHVEACPHLHRIIHQIRELGVRPGVALNPATPLAMVEEILPYVDLVLILSVNPGFGGQQYIPASTPRIARLRKMLDAIDSQAELEVDGGVHPGNAREIADAGATVLVAGSAIFNKEASVGENIAAFQKALA
jgi:ribulose-phosphate 3-epimerase